jgi:hypothetical protein
MAAPVVITPAVGVYTLAATAVMSVRATPLDNNTYYWTYRLTAAGAPTLFNEATDLSLQTGQIITFAASSDLYIWNTSGTAGRVRIDA